MAELLESSGTQRSLRQTEVTELFNSDNYATLSAGDDVVLRELSSGGEFARTVKCLPGSITIIPHGKDAEAFAPFREALLGKPSANTIEVRCGAHELHPSEVHIVSTGDVLAPGMTVERVLEEAGASDEEKRQALTAIGLEGRPRELTENLSQGLLRRLSIVCALFSRSRVVVFDNPFHEIESEWSPAVAGLILSAATTGSQIVIVTGLARIPRVWKASPLVVVAGLEIGARQGDTYIVEETIGYLTKIRHMIGRNHSVEDEGHYIITYPQRIFKRRRNSSDGALMAEAIRNPNSQPLDDAISEAGANGWSKMTQTNVQALATGQELTPAVARGNGVKKKRRNGKGRLTKVTSTHRMKNSKWYFVALNARQLRAMVAGSNARPMNAARFDHERKDAERQVELERMLFVLLLLTIFLLFVDLFAR